MRKCLFLPRFLALFLALSLALPSPVSALRNEQPINAGMEEKLTQALGHTAAGMEEQVEDGMAPTAQLVGEKEENQGNVTFSDAGAIRTFRVATEVIKRDGFGRGIVDLRLYEASSPIGYVRYRLGRLSVDGLYIEPEYRNQRLSTLLLTVFFRAFEAGILSEKMISNLSSAASSLHAYARQPLSALLFKHFGFEGHPLHGAAASLAFEIVVGQPSRLGGPIPVRAEGKSEDAWRARQAQMREMVSFSKDWRGLEVVDQRVEGETVLLFAEYSVPEENAGLLHQRINDPRVKTPESWKKAGAEEGQKLKPEEVYILVADDEPMITGLLSMRLRLKAQQAGMDPNRVLTAGTVGEALDLIAKYKPQFISTDMNMGDPQGRTGADVAKAAKEQGGPQTRVILVADLASRGQSVPPDVDLHIQKPTTGVSLEEELGRFLDERVEKKPEGPAAGAEEVSPEIKQLFKALSSSTADAASKMDLLAERMKSMTLAQKIQFVYGLSWGEASLTSQLFSHILLQDNPTAHTVRDALLEVLLSDSTGEALMAFRVLLAQAPTDQRLNIIRHISNILKNRAEFESSAPIIWIMSVALYDGMAADAEALPEMARLEQRYSSHIRMAKTYAAMSHPTVSSFSAEVYHVQAESHQGYAAIHSAILGELHFRMVAKGETGLTTPGLLGIIEEARSLSADAIEKVYKNLSGAYSLLATDEGFQSKHPISARILLREASEFETIYGEYKNLSPTGTMGIAQLTAGEDYRGRLAGFLAERRQRFGWKSAGVEEAQIRRMSPQELALKLQIIQQQVLIPSENIPQMEGFIAELGGEPAWSLLVRQEEEKRLYIIQMSTPLEGIHPLEIIAPSVKALREFYPTQEFYLFASDRATEANRLLRELGFNVGKVHRVSQEGIEAVYYEMVLPPPSAAGAEESSPTEENVQEVIRLFSENDKRRPGLLGAASERVDKWLASREPPEAVVRNAQRLAQAAVDSARGWEEPYRQQRVLAAMSRHPALRDALVSVKAAEFTVTHLPRSGAGKVAILPALETLGNLTGDKQFQAGLPKTIPTLISYLDNWFHFPQLSVPTIWVLAEYANAGVGLPELSAAVPPLVKILRGDPPGTRGEQFSAWEALATMAESLTLLPALEMAGFHAHQELLLSGISVEGLSFFRPAWRALQAHPSYSKLGAESRALLRWRLIESAGFHPADKLVREYGPMVTHLGRVDAVRELIPVVWSLFEVNATTQAATPLRVEPGDPDQVVLEKPFQSYLKAATVEELEANYRPALDRLIEAVSREGEINPQQRDRLIGFLGAMDASDRLAAEIFRASGEPQQRLVHYLEQVNPEMAGRIRTALGGTDTHAAGAEEKGTPAAGLAALEAYVKQFDLIGTIRLLAATGKVGDVTSDFSLLEEFAKKAGFSQGIAAIVRTTTTSEVVMGVPAEFAVQGIPIFVKKEWESEVKKNLEKLETAGLIRFVGSAAEAFLVIGDSSVAVQPGQVFIRINEKTVSRVTPQLLWELQQLNLLKPGSVVMLYEPLKDSVLIFA